MHKDGKEEQTEKAMQRILEAFANDDLRVEADVGKRSKEHQRVWELTNRLQDELEEKLGQKEKELFEELMDTMASESSYYAQERFIYGYRLGVLMTMEVFSDPDIFVWRGMDRT